MQLLTVEPAASQVGAVPLDWEQPVHLSTDATAGAFGPVIRADGNKRLIVVYGRPTEEGGTTVNRSVMRASLDQGATWLPPTVVYTGAESAWQVTVAVDSSNLAHAVWRTENSIYHAREDQWPTVANEVATAEQVFSPAVALEADDTIHVVWAQRSQSAYTLTHAFSLDDGVTWAQQSLWSKGGRPDAPDLALDRNGQLHVVWQQRSSKGLTFEHKILYKRGTRSDGDVNWDQEPTILSGDMFNVRLPTIEAVGDQLYVAFAQKEASDQTGSEHTVYVASYQPGVGWALPVDVSGGQSVGINAPLDSPQPAMLACAGRLHVYFDGTIIENGKERIIGVWRRLGEQTWSDRHFVTNEDLQAIRPSLVCVENRLHLAYEAIIELNPNHQIYYVAGGNSLIHLPLVTR